MKFFTLPFALLLLCGVAAAQTSTDADKPSRNIGRPGCNPGVPARLAKTATMEGLEYGDITEIADCRTVFVDVPDYEVRAKIVDELKKDPKFIVVGDADDADFFILFGMGSYSRGVTVTGNTVSEDVSVVGQMLVTVRGQIDEQDRRHQRIVWGKKNTRDYVGGMTLSRHPAVNATREFLKALKRARDAKK